MRKKTNRIIVLLCIIGIILYTLVYVTGKRCDVSSGEYYTSKCWLKIVKVKCENPETPFCEGRECPPVEYIDCKFPVEPEFSEFCKIDNLRRTNTTCQILYAR